uniref:HDC07055 n=1 Tax=Drosophila melanogaster TaxID=7227 RepID=Q6IG83_DROME|nr:TPA_inf: HDC07055 [Drosophila melanogaster]
MPGYGFGSWSGFWFKYEKEKAMGASARYANFESRKRSLDHNQPLSIRDDGPDLPVCSSGQNLRLSPHQKEAKTKC